MKNFRKLLMLNPFDEFTSFPQDFQQNPYLDNITFCNRGYKLYYSGEVFSVSTDDYSKFLDIGAGIVSVTIPCDDKKLVIDKFVIPDRSPFAYLWMYGCWSKSRLTEDRCKFASVFNKIDPSERILMKSKSMDLLYQQDPYTKKLYRKIALSHGHRNFDDCINLCRNIVELSMESSCPIGWKVDYISLEKDIKYDLILRQPYYGDWDLDGSIRKKIYLNLLTDPKYEIPNITAMSKETMIKNKESI